MGRREKSDVVKSPFGFHIIKVTEKLKGPLTEELKRVRVHRRLLRDRRKVNVTGSALGALVVVLLAFLANTRSRRR